MKKYVLLLLSLFLVFLVSCTKTATSDKVAQEYNFDNVKALKVAQEAMLYISKNQLEELKRISDDKVIEGLNSKKSSDLKVTGFKMAGISQKGRKALYTFNVSKATEGKAKADLESYYIRIDKEKDSDDYKVGKISASDIVSGISVGEQIRIRFGSDVNMDTLIKLPEIPTETYVKSMTEDTSKITVPKKEFCALGFSFDGKTALLATKEGNSTYIASVDFEKQKNNSPAGTISTGQGGGSTQITAFEKSIGSSLNSVDIYNDLEVQFLLFSSQNKYIIITYKNKNNAQRFKIYKTTGDMIDLKLDDKFDDAKYTLLYMECQNEKIKFEVQAANPKANIRESTLGTYSLNLKDMKLEKL